VNLALAASRDVNLVWAVSAALVVLNKMPKGTTVLLRRPRSGNPQSFETMVSAGARAEGLHVDWFSPPEDVAGRASVFLRDIAMIERADILLAFFSPGREGDGGTAHLAEKAVDRGIPVWTYLVTPGRITRHGEQEPSQPVAPEMRDIIDTIRSLQGDYNAARDSGGTPLHTLT
jgi:hypothetical protein